MKQIDEKCRHSYHVYMKAKDLAFLGLKDTDAKVYVTALELGETSVARIAKKSGLKRTTVSSTVSNLVGQGLMYSSRQGQRNVFGATDPRIFKRTLEEKTENLDALLPELLALANAVEHKPTVRFYEGLEGIKEAHQHTLEFSDYEMLFWVSDVPLTHESEDYWFNVYQPKRVASRITVRAIAPGKHGVKRFVDDDKTALRVTKLDDAKHYQPAAEIILYARRHILIASFKEGVALCLESAFIYKTLAAIFESHWHSLR